MVSQINPIYPQEVTGTSRSIRDNFGYAKEEIEALQMMPITFVFAGTPVEGSMINMPVIYNMTIPAFPNLSRYYNETNPLVASTFTLRRITAGGGMTIIGTISKPAGTAQATFSGAGSSALVPGDTLRMTATTIGGSLQNVGITIQSSRR